MKYFFFFSLFLLTACETTAQQEQTSVPENDMCICTQEYAPVCGSNNKTYGNSCEARCDKVKDFSEGACPKNAETKN